MLLAMRYNFDVPRGYTFVRPHRRGDASIEARKRVFRSRSATSVLYQVVQNVPSGKPTAWFDFERDVAAALSRLGLRVVHQAASRNGDGGVDVFASNEDDDAIWAIQCKCYAPAMKIGPDVVRELYGSLVKFPEGTRGMVITTSSFTSGAVEEARRLNIELVDGAQFLQLSKGDGAVAAKLSKKV